MITGGGKAEAFPPFRLNIDMWNTLKLITEDSDPVLDVEDIQSHLNLFHADETAYLMTLIEVATAFIEGPNGIGVALSPKRWRVSLSECQFRLPLRPVRSIVSVTRAGQPVDYSFDEDTGRIDCRDYKGTKVTFEAGYNKVPADLLHAIRMIVGHLYANREATATVKVEEVPMAVETILNRYRVYSV